MNKLIFLLSVLIVFSCGNESAQEENVTTKNNKNEKFIWDFSTPKKIIYSYSQTQKNVTIMRKDEFGDSSINTGIGNLNVKIKENQVSNLSMTDIESTIVSFDPDGKPIDTMTFINPPVVIQNMQTDGKFGNANTDLFIKLLFPLPSKDIELGEPDKTEMQIPFNVFGSRLWVKGYNILKFEKIDSVKNRKCAVLKSEVNISDLEIPEEIEGEYKSITKGNATYYFDLDDKIFVGSDIYLFMEIMTNTEEVENTPFGTYMEMKSENIIKIRLEKIEE